MILSGYISGGLNKNYDFVEMLFEVYVVGLFLFASTRGDSFASLEKTNATIGVIIDREYLGEEYVKIKSAIEAYIVYAKREILKHGGVNVQYFSWTSNSMKKDFLAVLTITSCSETWNLFKVAEKFHILHLAISEMDCPRLPRDKAITIPLITRGQELPQLMLDLRTTNTYTWNSAIVLYDHTLNRDQVTRLVKSISSETTHLIINTVAVSLLKLETSEGNSERNREFVNQTISSISLETVGNNFLAIASYETVNAIMEYAKKYGLVKTRTQWMYVISDANKRGQDVEKFQEFLTEGDNIAFIYNNTLRKNDTCSEGLQCHCEEILSAFSRALYDAILNEEESASQVSDEEWDAIRPTKKDLRDSLLQSVKLFLLQNGICGNCTSWLMKSGDTWGREYLKDSSSAVLLPVGNWRPSDGVSMKDELFPHIAHGFRKRNLPLVSFHNPPWQILVVNSSGFVQEASGLIFKIINQLSDNLNFTYTIDVVKVQQEQVISNKTEQDWSYEIAPVNTNFIPDELFDLVKNKTAAFGAVALTVTEDSKKIINFTRPVSVQSYTFLVARPRELSRALLFMSPFTRDTWLCLSATIISMGPILYFIHKFSPVYEYKGINRKGGLSSIQNCIWYMYGALLQQGGMHLPHADSARIIVGAWWLVVLVVVTTYCGNLVAFLTFPKIDIPITTINELLEHQKEVTWSFKKESFLETNLKTASQSRYRQLYSRNTQIKNSKNMVDDIVSGKHVRLDWKMTLQYIMKKQHLESDRCDLVLGLEEFFDEQLAMVFGPDTPYLDIINEQIKRLHQVGLIDKWLKDFLPKRDRCWKNRHIVEVSNHTVNLDDMQGSFFVLFLGFLLSLFVTASEKLWYKYTVKTRKKAIQPFSN